MAAQPQRRRHPLQRARRVNPLVVCHGIVAGVVEEVRPLINVLRTRLHRLLAGDKRDAAGREYPHHFVHRNDAGLFRHNQVHEVVRVWQHSTTPTLHADRPVQAERLNVLARCRHVLVEAVNDEAVVDAQRCGGLAIAAADVNNEAAFDATGLDDVIAKTQRD